MTDKFKWTKENTSLLISLWSDNSVQKHFQSTPRNVAIWNGISRYMRKRGEQVTWLQCRARIKRLMMRYRKIKRGAKLKLQNTADFFFSELDGVINKMHSKPMSYLESSLDLSIEATSGDEKTRKKTKSELRRSKPSSGASTQSSAMQPTEEGSSATSYKTEVVETAYFDQDGNDHRPSQSDEEAEASTSYHAFDANSKRHERLHLRMDMMLNKLNQILPFTTNDSTNTLETKVDLALSQLERTIPLASADISEHTNLDLKMGVMLERLEYIIPLIERYNTSMPFLVDKIDRLLADLDNLHHGEVIEISTSEMAHL